MRISTIAIGVSILFGVLSLYSCSNGTETRPPSTNAAAAAQDAKSDDPLAYSTAKLDPSKYAGRQVTWVGAVVSSTITATGITKFWKVEGEDDDSIFATVQDDEQRTEAAKARDKIRFDFTRKVTGTISNEQVEYQAGMDVVKVPLLNKVVVDTADTKAK